MYEANTLYHIYNQGNNREIVFREDENYRFFLKKMEKHLQDLVYVLAYCLMPNHFHFLIRPTLHGVQPSASRVPIHGKNTELRLQSVSRLSYGIQTMLTTYARAYNKQYGRSGSLFRQHTKVKDSWYLGKAGEYPLQPVSEGSYPVNCFHYIHNNPVAAELVTEATEWPFSSAQEYAGLREDAFCNYTMAKQILGVDKLRYRL